MRRFVLVILAVMALTALIAQATGAFELDPGMRERPGEDAGPTEVSIECFFIDVANIDDREQTFEADISIRLQWQDNRLARTGGKDVVTLPLTDIWNPRLRIANQRNVEEHFPDVVRVDRDGTVAFEQRYSGTFTTIADIRDFPFDERTIRITLITVDQLARDIKLVFEDKNIGRVEFFSIPNWKIGDVIPKVTTFSPFGIEEMLRLDLEMSGDRRSTYYIWSVIVPLLMIVMMSWSVFFVKPHHLSAQLAMAATSMLTLIAYRFAISNVLPPVSYMTRLDIFITGSTMFVFFALAEAVLTGTLADNDHEHFAEKMDSTARILFPSGFVVFVLVTLLFL
jgi:hypothetical protein